MCEKAMKYLLSCLLVICLAGCAGLNGKKNIDPQGVYHTAVGEELDAGSFSVKVPIKDMRYLKVQERPEEDGIYVSFSSTGFDFSVYRAMVGLRDPVPFQAYKEHQFPLLLSAAEEGYGQPMKKIYSTDTTFQGHPAFYAVYTQEIPESGMNPITFRSTAGDMLTHAIYMVYYKNHLVLLWGQYSANDFNTHQQVTDQNRNALINRTWKPMNDYVNSFKLTP